MRENRPLSFLHKVKRQAHQPIETSIDAAAHRRINRLSLGWKLFITWVIVPPVLLCMAEAGLRLAGSGVSTQPLLSQKVNGETVCTANRFFYQQFYTMPITTALNEFSMPAAKPPDTYRVFVFGSSAAVGVPSPDFSFWRILGSMLRATRHGGKTEIYSMAMSGSNSHVMRAAAKACAACQPDLFVVYMGNNELNPSVTQTMVWDKFPPWLALRLLHLNIALNDSRLVQLMRGVTGPADLERPHGREENVREPERVYEYYRANVNDICSFARSAGAKVALCTVGSRLREWTPEDAYIPAADAKAQPPWKEAFETGNRLREEGQYQEALAAYGRAANMDAGHAGLAYGIACCHYALGEYADARTWFVRTRELDVLHSRAGDRINGIIREIAAARAQDGVQLVDAAQSLSDASAHGVEGPEMFLDHVHLSFEGNCVLAGSILETLARTEPHLGIQGAPPSVEECRQRLALTLADRRYQFWLTARPDLRTKNPCGEGLNRALANLDAQVAAQTEDTTQADCLHALELDPLNEIVRARYARLLLGKGNPSGALEQARILTGYIPYSWQGHRLVAQTSAIVGDKSRAIAETRLMLDWNPYDADTYVDLGQYLSQDGQCDNALAAFSSSFKLRPGPRAQYEIARVLRAKGDYSGAVEACRRSLKFAPDDPGAVEELVIALCEADRLAEANEEMRHLHAEQAKPDSEQGAQHDENAETRMTVLRRLFRLLPENTSTACKFQGLFMDEATRLENAGDLTGIVGVCREAIPLNPKNNQPMLFLEKALAKSSPADRRNVWESIWKDNPGIALVAVYCGTARAATGDIDGANEAFSAAQHIAPEEWSYWVMAADALASAGASANAAAAYERALALNPKLDYLLDRLERARKSIKRPQ